MQNHDNDVFNEYTIMKTDKGRRVCAYCNENYIGSDIETLSKHSNGHAGFKKYDMNGNLVPGSPETALANFMQSAEQNSNKTTVDIQSERTSATKNIRKLAINKQGKAVGLTPYLFQCSTIPIRLFHISWMTFFVCFFTWFSISNLSEFIRDDLQLTVRDKNFAIELRSLSTIIFRIIFGDLCDKIGARYSYTLLLTLSCISFACLSTSYNTTSYFIFSFFTGIIGASFVITEYHIAQFFSTKSVGIASAMSAGWGNFGGGVTQVVTPLIRNIFVNQFGVSPHYAWRYTVLVPVGFVFLNIFVYYFGTMDTPKGNRKNIFNVSIRKLFCCDMTKYRNVCSDYRIWILALSYAVCFGVEVTVLNYFISYFMNQFGVHAETGGLILFFFSTVNLFARGFGGFLSDLLYAAYGIQGRIYCLFMVLLTEGLFISMFALSAFHLGYSLMMMVFFSCYVQIAEGVVFSIIPSFSNMKKYHGLYMGIIGAGGNCGAMIYSFLIFDNAPHVISYPTAWIILAIFVFASSFTVLFIKYTKKELSADAVNVDDDIWIRDEQIFKYEL